MSDSVVHFEVPYDDADRARGFYRDVFGWEITPMPDIDYTIVQTGATDEQGMPTSAGYIGGGMFERSSDIDRPVITINVDDMSAALDRLSAAGGKQVGETSQVADMGWAAYFHDSEGNLMGLWQSAQPG
ncbi:VOC family protein [Nocardioides donggukensis]|uniref:VOC family protein n=1 Tax=Nocardioides donggukensis TaxID=2774019 RepID=A0A927KAE6_9ACTN|nr:VOC family protein [Nocardioides donggukensis]MBD8870595.1 VOC family protein [Nocardioides donggukensis]